LYGQKLYRGFESPSLRHPVRAVWLSLADIEKNPALRAISPNFFHQRITVAAEILPEKRWFL
jgi:hypothetical protein